MSIVCFHVHARAQNRHSTIVVLRSVVNQSGRDGIRVVPQHLAGLRVERIGIVRAGNEHDSGQDHRCRFERAYGARMEYPLCHQPARVLRRDLCKMAEALSAVVSVVGDPIFSHALLKQIALLNLNIAKLHFPGWRMMCAGRLCRSMRL